MITASGIGLRSAFYVLRSTFYVLRSAFYVLRSTFYVLRAMVRAWLSVLSQSGTACACRIRMGARRFQDLEAWQLANALKLEVYALIVTGPVSRDREFCRQIRKSAASSSRNIAEGFGRFRPRPFAQYMEFSIGSTHETQDALQDGVDQGYFTPAKIARAQNLAERCLKVSTKLLLYLKRCRDDDLPFL